MNLVANVNKRVHISLAVGFPIFSYRRIERQFNPSWQLQTGNHRKENYRK